MSRVLTHNSTGYRRGCRCDTCRLDNNRRRREAYARQRADRVCDVCKRIHPGRCTPDSERSTQIGVTLPGRIARRLRERIAWGERSSWVARLIEAELDRLDTEEDQAA